MEDLKGNEEIEAIGQILQLMEFGGMESLVKAANKKVWLTGEFGGERLTKDIQKLNYAILVSEKEQFVTSSFPVICELYDTEDGITILKKAKKQVIILGEHYACSFCWVFCLIIREINLTVKFPLCINPCHREADLILLVGHPVVIAAVGDSIHANMEADEYSALVDVRDYPGILSRNLALV